MTYDLTSTKDLTDVTSENVTQLPQFPEQLMFTNDTLVPVIAYPCLFFVAASGNLMVLITLWRKRGFKSRVNLCIMHLSVADLIVAFVFIPLEVTWSATVSWNAGDVACRLCMFCRAFGFYLSSFLMVAISIDRYISIVHPLTMYGDKRRVHWLLGAAWVLSVICSLPQSVIFHVERHPVFTWFTQCVTFNFFPSVTHEMTYNVFNVVMVYLVPLMVIVTSYVLILIHISHNARNFTSSPETNVAMIRMGRCHRESTIRRFNSALMCKAKLRTLKMTLVIVIMFITCWTPYFFILCMNWFNKDLMKHLDARVHRALLIFAVSNSCIDPVVYGMFTATFRQEATHWKSCVRKRLYKLIFGQSIVSRNETN